MRINADQITAYCRDHREIREIIHEALLLDRVSSTNKVALKMASDGFPEGVAILAERQTKGRGRFDREWFSPDEKNIYMSLLLRPSIQIRDYPLFSPATAVGLMDGIQAFTGCDVRIKWPNDLMISDKKVGGILLETGSSGAHSPPLVIGIGMNVNLDNDEFPVSLRETATSLKIESGAALDRTGLVMSLIEGVCAQIHRLEKNQGAEVIQSVRKRCTTLGQKIRVSTPNKVFEGSAKDIDEDGALLVQLGDRSFRRILIGDITHLRALNHKGPVPSSGALGK